MKSGDVFEGFAFYNALVRHRARIEVDVDGAAFSIAPALKIAAKFDLGRLNLKNVPARLRPRQGPARKHEATRYEDRLRMIDMRIACSQ